MPKHTEAKRKTNKNKIKQYILEYIYIVLFNFTESN